MHSFEVNSNESACRKSGSLGLDQEFDSFTAAKKKLNYGRYLGDYLLTLFG